MSVSLEAIGRGAMLRATLIFRGHYRRLWYRATSPAPRLIVQAPWRQQPGSNRPAYVAIPIEEPT